MRCLRCVRTGAGRPRKTKGPVRCRRGPLVVGEALSDQRTRPPHDPPVAVIVLVVVVIIGRFAFMATTQPWPVRAVNRRETQASDACRRGGLATHRHRAYISISNEMNSIK